MFETLLLIAALVIGGYVVYFVLRKVLKAMFFVVSMGIFYLILKYVVGVF